METAADIFPALAVPMATPLEYDAKPCNFDEDPDSYGGVNAFNYAVTEVEPDVGVEVEDNASNGELACTSVKESPC
ncbi:hypothetical protein NMY22_g10756 [Coprinellus aureogranulatus]|nr:hypothetical protein NMY22_g10756 [Coprinellus aureogranulatus]